MPSAALWRQVDINATAPGWVRYGPAEPAKLLTAAQLASLTAVEKPMPKAQPQLPAALPVSTATTAALPAQSTTRGRPLSMVVINRAPLTDERAMDGGLLPSLLSAGLKLAAPSLGEPPAIKWSKSDPLSLQLLTNETGADLLLPWDLADCDRPSGLTQTQAMLCDRAVFSDPIMQVVVGLFTLADSTLKFDSDSSIDGRSICVPLDRDLTELTAPGRNWIAEKRITLVRLPTLIDCIGLVQRREADALVATDLEGWTLLRQIGIPTLFAMADRPLGTRTIHAAVWKNHPQADTMIETVNRAIRQVKESGGHANLVRQHLMSIWDNKISVR
jgi:ABC-type amino acid transport substrate-binding protein